MPKVILGVSGGVAAYKAVSICRLLIESGHDVTVVPTPSALNFVGKATWEAITGKPVYAEVFEATDKVAHVALARSADLVIVAPATADLLFRAASGAANDMLTAIILTTTAPVIYFPAMHSEMWTNQATSENVNSLKKRGHTVINPDVGPLARGDEGIGRLPEPDKISRLVNTYLAKEKIVQDFSGVKALVTLGGTVEEIDPVRFISNKSSGEMGSAICRALYLRGAKVTAIVAQHTAVLPHDIEIHNVVSANEMGSKTLELAKLSNLVVMAGAVSDFSVDKKAEKIQKSVGMNLQLVATEDILSRISKEKLENQFLVGFAAQTEEIIPKAISKLAAKKCDLMVANQVGFNQGFGAINTEIHLISQNGIVSSGTVTKDQAAHKILDSIKELWKSEH